MRLTLKSGGLMLVFLFVSLLVFSAPVRADQAVQEETPAAAPEVEEQVDPFERQTPRSSLKAFLHAIEQDDLDTASRYLDLRFMPPRFRLVEGRELSRMLDFVMTRRLTVDLGGLSDEQEGDLTDGLPRSREILGVIKGRDKEVTLYLQRVPSGEGIPVWKVSSVTVANIAEMYEKLEYPSQVKWFQSNIPKGSLLGLEYFKWVLVLITMLAAYPFAYIIGLILTVTVSRRNSPMRIRLRLFFVRPVAILIIFFVGRWMLLELGMGISAQRIAKSNTLMIIVFTWVMLSAISLIRDMLTIRLKKRDRLAATVLLRPLANSIKGILVLTAVIVWLDNSGFDVTTLMAGLGIGGLAIALALQKPMEDLFGAFTLFTQQPIHVHDFCRFGAVLGTVEEIGLRSSRIRTLDDTVVTVPNARFASEYLENYSARGCIRHRVDVRLLYDTTAEQLRNILEETRVMLKGHERVKDEGFRSNLKTLGKHGFIIEVVGYINTTGYAEYLEIGEDLNLSIAEIVSGAGAKFASPLAAEGGI